MARTAIAYPDLGAWSFVYDAGRLTSRTDALGRVLTKTSRQGTGSAVTTTNTYDEVRSTFFNKGALTAAANPTATITYDYENGARLAERSWTIAGLSGTKTETTAWWPSGEVKYKTWPDGDTTGSTSNPLDL